MAEKPGAVMARKKSAKQGKHDAPIRQVGVRASAAWAEWLERGAAYCRTDASKLIDVSVCDYLKTKGFDEPPPPRL